MAPGIIGETFRGTIISPTLTNTAFLVGCPEVGSGLSGDVGFSRFFSELAGDCLCRLPGVDLEELFISETESSVKSLSWAEG